MNFDRAVRLRELWNGSFNLSLSVVQESNYNYILFGTKVNTPPNMLAILVRLSDQLSLRLKVDDNYFVIA